jgi:hypothetical protein
MTADQRKRLLGTIFEEITVGAHGVSELVPREAPLHEGDAHGAAGTF